MDTMQDGQTAPRRRARRAVKRSRTIRFDLTEREFGEIQAAAEQAGLAKGAFVAQAALAVARSGGRRLTVLTGRRSASSSAPPGWYAGSAST